MYFFLFFRTENDTRSGRRSLRKREGKSYVEDDFNFMLGEDKSGPNSPLKGGKRRGSEAANANSRLVNIHFLQNKLSKSPKKKDF